MKTIKTYTVRIFSQSRQEWTTAIETTLAACIRLVEGLRTDWTIEGIAEIRYNPVLESFAIRQLTRSFKEARRKLIRVCPQFKLYWTSRLVVGVVFAEQLLPLHRGVEHRKLA